MKTASKKVHEICTDDKFVLAGHIYKVEGLTYPDCVPDRVFCKISFSRVEGGPIAFIRTMNVNALDDFEIVLNEDEEACGCTYITVEQGKRKSPCITHYTDYFDPEKDI